MSPPEPTVESGGRSSATVPWGDGRWLPSANGALFGGLDPVTALVIVKLRFLMFESWGLLVGAELAERSPRPGIRRPTWSWRRRRASV